MTDVLVPLLIPYARFLEVRARRLQIVTELTQPAPERPIDVVVASATIASDERARAAVRVLAEEDPIDCLDAERDPLAAPIRFAVASGGDGASLRLLFRGVRNDDVVIVPARSLPELLNQDV